MPTPSHDPPDVESLVQAPPVPMLGQRLAGYVKTVFVGTLVLELKLYTLSSYFLRIFILHTVISMIGYFLFVLVHPGAWPPSSSTVPVVSPPGMRQLAVLCVLTVGAFLFGKYSAAHARGFQLSAATCWAIQLSRCLMGIALGKGWYETPSHGYFAIELFRRPCRVLIWASVLHHVLRLVFDVVKHRGKSLREPPSTEVLIPDAWMPWIGHVLMRRVTEERRRWEKEQRDWDLGDEYVSFLHF